MASVGKQKFAVLLPSGIENSSRLLSGINQFLDEHPALEIVEIPYKYGDEDPLRNCAWDFSGAVLWTDRKASWVSHLVERGIPTVNCCRDWLGHPGIVSMGVDIPALCEMIFQHLRLLQPRQIASVGVNFGNRPHTEILCRNVLQLASDAGIATELFELLGDHPDDRRSRITDMDDEPALLQFLSRLRKPCAIWAENDYVARMICNAAAYLELRVPAQVAVLGSNDYRISTAEHPTISTIPRLPEQLGKFAVEKLYEWVTSNKQPDDGVLAPLPIIARESTIVSHPLYDTMSKARRIIDAEACQGITVEQLSDRLDMSKMTLTTHFSEIYGLSPGLQIRAVKLEEAKRLLRETQQTLGDVAAAIGFSDHSKFSKFFKRLAGMTPSDYRAQEHDSKSS